MKSFIVFLIGVFAAVYLLNFTFGVVELPDNWPIIGNIDEGVATLLLLNALKYFGIDLTNIFKRNREEVIEIPHKTDMHE